MDKLAAISGLATAFHQLLGDDQYMAGLWKSCLLGSLLWRTEEGAVRNNVLNAPSWSWLSIDGPVSYGAWDSIIFELARSRSYRQIKSLESDLPHYDLLKTTLISLPERSDQFHRGQKCAITLRGRWFTILPLARYGDNEGGTYSTENSPAGPAFVCLDPTRPNLYAFKESLFFEIGESGELSEASHGDANETPPALSCHLDEDFDTVVFSEALGSGSIGIFRIYDHFSLVLQRVCTNTHTYKRIGMAGQYTNAIRESFSCAYDLKLAEERYVTIV